MPHQKKSSGSQNQEYESLQQAALTADSVSVSLVQKNYAEVYQKLNNVASQKKQQYVFRRESVVRQLLLIVAAIVFLCVFGYILFFSISTAVFSAEYRTFGLVASGISVGGIVFNVFCITRQVKEILFFYRYSKIFDIIKFHTISIIEDVASFTKRSIQSTVSDIEKAIKRDLIPQGHFSYGKKALMVSDDIYAVYCENRAVYDRFFRKQIEERDRMHGRSKEIERILAEGNAYVSQIRACNDIIKDRRISAQLDHMEKIVATIFHEIDINPKQANKIGMFLNYYLPTTEKLLEAYIDLSEKPVQSSSAILAKQEIEGSIEKINQAYESLLDRFFQEQEIDIASDIATMKTMMTQEGLDTEGSL